MAYYSRSDLVTQLTRVEARIEEAEKSQSLGVGGVSRTRGNLSALYRERDFLVGRIESLDRASTGGTSNLVEFGGAS